MKYSIAITFILIISLKGFSQTLGCTDPQAINYNTTANYNDGSCVYSVENVSITSLSTLPNQVNELSGLVYYNGKLYGHQDSGGAAVVYEIDPTSYTITKMISLQGATNIDWEDITQSETHFFVADTGNNANGNRQDLKIYKFSKASITSGTSITVPTEVINFSYEDQTDFAPAGANNTAFDCEAIGYNRGKLHLFTKNWIGTTTSHYVLPSSSGTYIAEKKESYDTGDYKITGAEFGAYDLLALVGYQVSGIPNIRFYLSYGFDDSYNYLTSGSTRFFNIGSVLSKGQVEAVCFKNPLYVHIGNESFTRVVPIFGTVNVSQQLYGYDILSKITPYYSQNQVIYSEQLPKTSSGTLRYNDKLDQYQGYDGTHWNQLGKKGV